MTKVVFDLYGPGKAILGSQEDPVASNTFEAGVKDYRANYWTPDYVPLDTDLLAVFKIVAQAGVPREEAAAAVAAESSTGTWTTVWTDLLTDLDYYRGRAYRIEPSRAIRTRFTRSSPTRSICSKRVRSSTC